VGSGVGPADADVVELADVAESDGSGGTDHVGADAVVGVGGPVSQFPPRAAEDGGSGCSPLGPPKWSFARAGLCCLHEPDSQARDTRRRPRPQPTYQNRTALADYGNVQVELAIRQSGLGDPGA
jgi:hypothetical protein